MTQKGWIKRLMGDDDGVEKLEDKYPTNTYVEIYLLTLIGVGGLLCFLIALSMLATWLGWY